MNIESSNVKKTKEQQVQTQKVNKANDNEASVKFTDELKIVEAQKEDNKERPKDVINEDLQLVNNENEKKASVEILDKLSIQNSINKPNLITKNVDKSIENDEKIGFQEQEKALITKTIEENMLDISKDQNEKILLDLSNDLALKNEKNEIVAPTQTNQLKTKELQLEGVNNRPLEEQNSEIVINKPIEELSQDNIVNKSQVELNLEDITNKPSKETKNDLKTFDDLSTKEQSEQNLTLALNDMNNILEEFNQSEDKKVEKVKEKVVLDDKNTMINNDFNIQENKDIMPQMNPSMNFSGDGQPFSSFMNEEKEQKKNNSILGNNAQDLAEEAAILSTMAENIAIANKNEVLNETKVVVSNEGIKKVNTRTNIKVEDIVKYDSILMNQADVDVFVNLVEKGEVNLNDLTSKNVEKSTQVSKTLADMLAKAMDNNQPIRINFDNNISVIIRISREGKITADFLPSSQVAEAYLKENLPLLRQKFDDNNIDYESLNQRERREQNRENNKKKGRNNE